MRIEEAIAIGKKFVSDNIGVSGDPEMVRLARQEGHKSWILVFPSSLINAKLENAGTVIDGGEYILRIDWQTKAVAVE